MKDEQDELIERVLSGLRAAEPHAGLEQRVQRRLEQVAAHPIADPRFVPWRRRVVGFGAVAAATLLISFLALHNGNRGRRAVSQQSAASPASIQQEATSTGAPVAAIASLRRPRETRRSSPLRRVEVSGPTPIAASYLPSFPAPPEPLTAQEKLLVRVVRHPDPKVVAQLNPQVREQVASLDAKEFQQFFRPSAIEEKINALQAAQLPPQK